MNADITNIRQESSKVFKLSVVPQEPGFLSIALAKTISTENGNTLRNPPIIEFNYLGATITSTRVTTSTTSSVTITIQTSKPSSLWILYLTSSASPTTSQIISQGQVTSPDVSDTHVVMLANLQAETTYYVYIAGKEATGTLLSTENAHMAVATRGSTTEDDLDSKSDGTLCSSGWAIASATKKLELLPCSYHGYCRQSKCM